MDWESIVSHLAFTQPAMVVDGALRVLFANAAMCALLGRAADELDGRALLATCTAQPDRSGGRRVLTEGLGGATSGDLLLVDRSGRHLSLRITMSREGSGRSRGLVIVAQQVRARSEPPPPSCDCSFDVSLVPAELGRVKHLRFLDPTRDGSPYVGRSFGDVLEAVGASAAHAAATAVLEARAADVAEVVLHDADPSFRVITARQIDGETMRITLVCLDSDLLPELVDAKVARVADASGLSERERQVLQLLLRGRGVEDIATMLEIAPRTVKFHQANVLQKLGADSRLDLLRVVL